MKSWKHVLIGILVIFSLVLGWSITGSAQGFPTKPITFVIPTRQADQPT
jgi:tripartite-type tricarboxylate transporter receptor subunit TctC